ncbi:MAG TPA: methionyl-tRNA formyltransferase [Caldisericia bacterium]|nr:methionyl-tRNA formyltransferase [Caldisericia bacterium]HPF49063.1 methionyl-tRNA formyltransferase [Caldisericia bacterium]HPI83073.1 methionyl-tRNA formyltransferase [Caldisericia bacterium]HPQ92300.1 methionyl-tRNA formyltransferase [Caldisericia bacterium]HRV74602.1 methionyl-tRNA formyltransferase [Caldisericia bacterium]
MFIGSGEFALPIIKCLNGNFELALCVTRPDKPKGRGKKVSKSVVASLCEDLNVAVFTPQSINDSESIEFLSKQDVDIAVLASYSEILKPELISIFKHGIVNVHPSLLPKYRGAEPIRWAIRKGERETGVSLMVISSKLDRGNVLLQETCPIENTDNFDDLRDRLAEMSVSMLPDMVNKVVNGYTGNPQDQTKTFYARRMREDDELIDWNHSANRISRRVRSMSYSPGCYTFYKGERLKLFNPREIDETNNKPGKIISAKKRLIVGTGVGCIEFLHCQREGKRMMDSTSFLNSRWIEEDTFFSDSVDFESKED